MHIVLFSIEGFFHKSKFNTEYGILHQRKVKTKKWPSLLGGHFDRIFGRKKLSFFFNTRFLTSECTQVEQFGATNTTNFVYSDAVDER